MIRRPPYQREHRRPGCTAIVKAGLCTLAAALVGACADGPDARYYYPVADLTDGLVYAYEPAPPLGGAPHYWYYRSVETPDSTLLISTYYDAQFEPRQLVRERIVTQGSLLRDLRLYFPTASGESAATQAEVLQPALFSFEAPDPERLLVSAVRVAPGFGEGRPGAGEDTLSQNPPSARYTVTRNRHYRRDTTYVLDGVALAAQVWDVRELTEQDSLGVLAIESRAVEVYAEGVGLVYRERRFDNGEGEAYRLAARMPMDSLGVLAGGGGDGADAPRMKRRG